MYDHPLASVALCGPGGHLAPRATGAASLDLLHQGSAEAFVDALCADALEHPAVDHPYLRSLAHGDLPDTRAALRDYCHQYGFYCADFSRYIEAVIGRLDSPPHRLILLQNLSEERGLDASHPDQVPHRILFQQLQRAAGVTPEYAAKTPPCPTVRTWRDLFMRSCASHDAGVGIGALGIGTELIVPTIYRFLHRAVTEHTDMTPDDYRFLTVHLECDDGHADQLKEISIDLAEDPERRESLRFGALHSLHLRSAFWDAMLARSLAG